MPPFRRWLISLHRSCRLSEVLFSIVTFQPARRDAEKVINRAVNVLNNFSFESLQVPQTVVMESCYAKAYWMKYTRYSESNESRLENNTLGESALPYKLNFVCLTIRPKRLDLRVTHIRVSFLFATPTVRGLPYFTVIVNKQLKCFKCKNLVVEKKGARM